MTVLRRSRNSGRPQIEDVADVTQRLAVLLSAGVAPGSAWDYLLPPPGRASPSASSGAHTGVTRGRHPSGAASTLVVQAAASAGRRGEDIAEAIVRAARTLSDEDARAWLSLAAAWAVATAAGSPMAPCLRLLAESFRDLGQLQRDLQVALAGPAATARLVMALPLVGVLFGALMGFNTVATLLGTTPGLACLAIGSALLFVGRRWNARLVRGARAVDAAPGLGFELTAIAMTGGASVSRARALVRSAEEQYGIGGASADTAIERVLDLSARAGVPAVELLRSEAAQQRREARAVGQRKAATLGVTLMIPLALCVLPAFMVVGVMPLLLSVLSSTFGEL